MKVAIAKERQTGEARVAATPDSVKKMVSLGMSVVVESGAGSGASLNDTAYKEAGAEIAKSDKSLLSDADVVLRVARPGADEVEACPKGTLLIGQMSPYQDQQELEKLIKQDLTVFALELLPRISRAQAMDTLSSQANLAGYKAVIDAAAEYGRALPMMMTAAGRINPAKVLVMGAGVAGLQAIATARRLGGRVYATDVRPAAKEQVESLGAEFVAVEDEEFKAAETAGGYAKEMSDSYKKKQAELIAETIADMDLVITTAQIPGRPAPRLIDEGMVKSMRAGSVIFDLAAEGGGNCALTQPGKLATKHGIKIIGYRNVPSRLAADASLLYANNLFNFLSLLYDKESKALKVDWDDEIVKGTLLGRDGKAVHSALTGKSQEADQPADSKQASEEGKANG
ncbi:MAG: Re/Si-specific NAD(P)(+) transhydrogenase subunit alpha [Pseudomonadota bacterium]|uniref:Re/Si-specific NAD(P)(+) transhydrogenase subunit alpha n=1 Tax=Fodinicurvata fenggangensis TaxID=1121830 RepID=UPI0004797E8A|nr:Re/Si-specific NAD(P)(+) transhydrogenase subunit alpha [Fodinicurvata fenggangensis]